MNLLCIKHLGSRIVRVRTANQPSIDLNVRSKVVWE